MGIFSKKLVEPRFKDNHIRGANGYYEILAPLTIDEVLKLAADKDLKHLQFSTQLSVPTLQLLNDHLFSARPEIPLRCYGFYREVCDLKFAQYLTNVTKFSADSLHGTVLNIDSLSLLSNLKELGIGMWELEDLGFLEQIPNSLTHLAIHQSKSSKPDLALLSRFCDLEELYLEGQTKHIQVIGELKKLKRLTLRSITTKDITYLLPHKQTLQSLDIKLGGISDLSLLEDFVSLEYLELWQIRGLSDIQFISSLVGLERIKLESLPRVTSLPSFKKLNKLEHIELGNMKGLRDISSLGAAPALKSFLHWSAGNMQIDDYKPLLASTSLKNVSVGFGSKKRNEAFVKLIESKGKVASI